MLNTVETGDCYDITIGITTVCGWHADNITAYVVLLIPNPLKFLEILREMFP